MDSCLLRATENHLLLDSLPENAFASKSKSVFKVVIKNTLMQVILTFSGRQQYHNKHFNCVIFIQMINPCLGIRHTLNLAFCCSPLYAILKFQHCHSLISSSSTDLWELCKIKPSFLNYTLVYQEPCTAVLLFFVQTAWLLLWYRLLMFSSLLHIICSSAYLFSNTNDFLGGTDKKERKEV